ncbi:hypothetical protein [Scopulibacillus cellulosilyticus]|uniref:Cytosolic protein n=1 Tax=Scopulibacillus cellulosilyticus TaxID=2665665 RepID=A0ABW2PY22_9BACL
MFRRKKKLQENYTDFSNVEDQRKFLTAEEFPEGTYGDSAYDLFDEPVFNKSEPWDEGQSYISGFTYEYRNMHENRPRKYPGAHKTHDQPYKETEPPFQDTETP